MCGNRIVFYIYITVLCRNFLTGYYQFEIQLSKKQATDHSHSKYKLISQKTIYRRFSDLEILYDGLIKFNPGSLIMKIPEKSFWCNIAVCNKNELVNTRKEKIENYLNYINKHMFLSQNPVYLIFISDDFERYKNEIKDGIPLYEDLMQKFKNNFISVQKKQPMIGNSSLSEMNIDALKNEKSRLEKIEKGVNYTLNHMSEILKQNKNKYQHLLKLADLIKNLKESNFKLELKDVKDDFIIMKENLSNESDCFKEICEKLNVFNVKVEELCENVRNYQNVLNALIEIFDRKKQIEFELQKEKNEEFLTDSNIIANLEKKCYEMNVQFYEEMKNFKQSLEGEYLEYIKSFFELKHEFDNESKKYFSTIGNENELI